MGGDGYEPDGWEPPCGWDLPGPECEHEPDDITDPALMRLLDLLPGYGDLTDAEMGSICRAFDPDAAPLHELFRVVLLLRRTRLARPVLALLLRLLRLLDVLVGGTGQDVTRPLGADRRPAADLTPPVALLRARSVLTCAPPARVPCPAGATG